MSNAQVRGNMSAYAIALFTFVLTQVVGEDTLQSFRAIRATSAGMHSLIAGAILIPVSVLIAAVIIPPAFQAIYGANTSGWNSSVVSVFQILLPVLTVIAIAYSYVRELTG